MDRIDFLKSIIQQSVDAEVQVAPIINKCRDDMKNIMSNVDHMVDNQMVIENLKTGDQPPRDMPFEEIPNGVETKVGTLGRKKSKAKLNKSTEENSLFGKKRELEKQIEDMENEIEKGNSNYFNAIFKNINFRQKGNCSTKTNGSKLHKQSQIRGCLQVPI